MYVVSIILCKKSKNQKSKKSNLSKNGNNNGCK